MASGVSIEVLDLRHFAAPLDSNTEDGYLSACWAVEQFLFDGPVVEQGFDQLFAGYAGLSYDTKRAFLEALPECRRFVDGVAAPGTGRAADRP